MSDLDHAEWLNGPERDAHPGEDYDAPETLCAHGRDMGRDCLECQVMAETALWGAFRRALDRIRQQQDEELGVALAARFARR